MPDIEMYYNIGKYTLVNNHPYLESLNRLLAIANQLGNRATLYAMDALRNLVVQAFLIDKINLAQKILQAGLIKVLHEIIGKAIKQL